MDKVEEAEVVEGDEDSMEVRNNFCEADNPTRVQRVVEFDDEDEGGVTDDGNTSGVTESGNKGHRGAGKCNR